jgi:hypothetical protein
LYASSDVVQQPDRHNQQSQDHASNYENDKTFNALAREVDFATRPVSLELGFLFLRLSL